MSPIHQCPGQNPRHWGSNSITEYKCPNCGSMVEFFHDDMERPCVECNHMVMNPKLNPTCADWCKFADKCGIGE